MRNQLVSFVESIKADRRVVSLDEAAIKQGVVLRLLSLLGWDAFNTYETTPEYSIAGKRVDYSLRINNVDKVFIEVKKAGEELETHQEQLLNYSFQQGVKLAILTNGVTWWFYLPLHEGSWEQRKFYTIDVIQQGSEDIASKFVDFLAKDNVSSGKAVQNAEAIYRSQQKVNILRETIPEAWNKIVEEADELLINLINETVERLCGYKADISMIEQFLSDHKDNLIISNIVSTRIVPRGRPSIPTPESHTGKSISVFRFRGLRYEVQSWKELLIKLCEILKNAHGSEFDKTLGIVGRKRPYFTHNANELRQPGKISNTNIFVETNLSANNIVKICLQMLAAFGYSSNDLTIEAQKI